MVKTNYDFLNDDIKKNLERKMQSSTLVRGLHDAVIVEIFIESSHPAKTMWDQQLSLGMERRRFRYDRELIQTPKDYKSDHYAPYEKELDEYIENYLVQHNHHGIYGHVFNMGTVAVPLMHLVLSKGPLRREYLGSWIQNWSDDEDTRGGVPPSPSSLADNLEACNIAVASGNFVKNGASPMEIDTYLLRKRLAKLTKNPTDRVRSNDPDSLSDETTVSRRRDGAR